DYFYENGEKFHRKKQEMGISDDAIEVALENNEVEIQKCGYLRFWVEQDLNWYYMIVNPDNNECVHIYPRNINEQSKIQRLSINSI
ncbi:MAG: hypothetical protein ABEI86_10315, partial [Halobacteriaceae archaeon]